MMYTKCGLELLLRPYSMQGSQNLVRRGPKTCTSFQVQYRSGIGSSPECVRALALLSRVIGCKQSDRKAADIGQQMGRVRHDGQTASGTTSDIEGTLAFQLQEMQSQAAHLFAMKPPTTSTIMKTKHITRAAVSVL